MSYKLEVYIMNVYLQQLNNLHVPEERNVVL